MPMLKDGCTATQVNNNLLTNKNYQQVDEETTNNLPLSYFDLLDETPEYSEAAILLADGTVEYCYIRIGRDGSQYFGFSCSLPGSSEYNEIIGRHKLTETMAANTFERYPSGKTMLSRGGRILEISMPKQGKANV